MTRYPAPYGVLATNTDDLTLYASTVLLEAESEPEEGKLAVAWVIRNRMDASKTTARRVILGPDETPGDWEAFSCWNRDYTKLRMARLIAPDETAWGACWRAAVAAHWRLIPDPTHGATFYLNPALTRQVRARHDLPTWYDPTRVTLMVGKHEFLTA